MSFFRICIAFLVISASEGSLVGPAGSRSSSYFIWLGSKRPDNKEVLYECCYLTLIALWPKKKSNLCLVHAQPRKTCFDITETLLIGT